MDSYRLGIDIGGTFTDFVLLDAASGEISIEKCLTTGARPDVGVFEGVDRLAERHPGYLARAHDVNHATTLVTNVILERRAHAPGSSPPGASETSWRWDARSSTRSSASTSAFRRRWCRVILGWG